MLKPEVLFVLFWATWMTTLTGSTAATLSGTVDPPTVSAAIAGAIIQIATLSSIWFTSTSAATCCPDPRECFDDPWARQVLITLTLCLALWLYSLRTIPSTGTSDPSIVDRLWSILPFLYCWHWYFSVPSARQLLMALLTTVWGVRLTVNFALKGGFSGGEDYRWKEIRTWPGFDRGWEGFNFLFICGFQQLVILAFTSPAAAALRPDAPPLNWLDAVAAALFLLLVAGEAIADYQMFVFQTEKYRRICVGEPLGPQYEPGFVQTGLWAYSRHPNYFCEVSLWWAFYLFSLAAGAPILNWTMSGPVFLTCLFTLPHASLDVAETLSSRKYAQYAEYQARVSRFFPMPPRPAGEVLKQLH
jgi:steroid 5-alpha reductase family enzyme